MGLTSSKQKCSYPISGEYDIFGYQLRGCPTRQSTRTKTRLGSAQIVKPIGAVGFAKITGRSVFVGLSAIR